MSFTTVDPSSGEPLRFLLHHMPCLSNVQLREAATSLRTGCALLRFWVLETVARIPYFAFISMLHLYETLGWWRAAAPLRKAGVPHCKALLFTDARQQLCHPSP